MTYRLYLDDLRTPSTANWVVVRSYDEAVRYVQTHGWPSVVSLDHDLGDDVPTGYDFARWLVELDMDTNTMPKDWIYNIHSANPVGAANIQGLLNGYIKQRKWA